MKAEALKADTMEDSQLLQDYAASRRDEAFKALVDQYVGLVYSACLRRLKDRHLAEDATQAVFLLLSQKAASLSQSYLSGWLLTTSRYACANIRKSEQRRQRREERAAMNQVTSPAAPDADVLDLLDDALCHLKPADREALVLRHLREQPLRNVAEALGISEDAARKRVNRGMSRLRRYFFRRGITTTTDALGVMLVQQIPGASLSAASRHALAEGVVQVCQAGGHGASASVAIAKGTKTMMLIAKLKTAAAVAVIAAAIGTTSWRISLALADSAPPPQAAAPAPASAPPSAPPVTVAPVALRQGDSVVGVLTNGVSIEVLGVAQSPSNGGSWWKADGSPLANPPYYKFGGQVDPENMLALEVAVHIEKPTLNPGQGRANVHWDVVNCDSRSASDPSPAAPGLEAKAFRIKDDPAGFTVRAVVAAGDWTTQYTAGGGGNSSQSNSGPFGLGRRSFLCGPANSDRGKTRITAVCSGVGGDDPDVRMVAVDDAGNEHPALTETTISDGTTTIGQFLSELPKASIKKWEFQTRPFDQWIEIRHVALRPGQKTQVQIVTSDGK